MFSQQERGVKLTILMGERGPPGLTVSLVRLVRLHVLTAEHLLKPAHDIVLTDLAGDKRIQYNPMQS